MSLSKGIGLGTFPFANPFTPISKEAAIKIIHSFLDNGGQYIDTAPTYAFGEVEELVGKALKESSFSREGYFIGSMCGYALENNKFIVSGKYSDVLLDCEKSLKRMQVDYFDVYMSHLPDPDTPFEETMNALGKLKEQGKIIHIGVSNVNLGQLKEYNKNGLVDFVENRYSLLNQNISDEFIKYCKTNEIRLVVFQVMERGLLSNKIINKLNFRDGDLRNKKPEFNIEVRERIGEWVNDYLNPIAMGLGISVSALALWWSLNRDFITICLNGVTSEMEFNSNIQAMSVNKNSEILEKIDNAYKILEDQIKDEKSMTVREFLGLVQYNIYKGSNPSGK